MDDQAGEDLHHEDGSVDSADNAFTGSVESGLRSKAIPLPGSCMAWLGGTPMHPGHRATLLVIYGSNRSASAVKAWRRR